jgi:flagellar protein FlgJ
MSLHVAQVVTDFAGLAALKTRAREDRDASIDEVARQFESLFMQMMLKNMRSASFGGGLLDSQQSLFYRDMYDQQLALHLANAGGMGIADAVRDQLRSGAPAAVPQGRDIGVSLADRVREPSARTAAEPEHPVVSPNSFEDPAAFVETLRPAAERAAAQLGVAPEALLAQAALETGWGKHVMPRADGESSYNLFGIKADRRWHGDRVVKTTLEYRDGVAVKTRAAFRAYDSYEASFADYSAFITGNPRYGKALAVASSSDAYLRELQKAGYATDPRYAEKIGSILNGEALAASADQVKQAFSRPL